MSAETAEAELPELAIIRAPLELSRWLQLQGTSIEELRARNNRRPMVVARLVVMRYLHRRGWSSVMIGRFLGRDHSTVLHHLRRPNPLGGITP